MHPVTLNRCPNKQCAVLQYNLTLRHATAADTVHFWWDGRSGRGWCWVEWCVSGEVTPWMALRNMSDNHHSCRTQTLYMTSDWMVGRERKLCIEQTLSRMLASVYIVSW